jgi:hypothetical protein
MKIALSPENKNETTVAFVTFHSLTNWNGDFLKNSSLVLVCFFLCTIECFFFFLILF